VPLERDEVPLAAAAVRVVVQGPAEVGRLDLVDGGRGAKAQGGARKRSARSPMPGSVLSRLPATSSTRTSSAMIQAATSEGRVNSLITIVLKSGRRYPVRDPERLAIGGGRIGLVEPFAIIDLAEIASLVADDDGTGDAPP
jgi:hypothetical protein